MWRRDRPAVLTQAELLRQVASPEATRSAVACTLITSLVALAIMLISSFYPALLSLGEQHGVLVKGELHFSWPESWGWVDRPERWFGSFRLANGTLVDGFTALLAAAAFVLPVVVSCCVCNPFSTRILSPLARAQTSASIMHRLVNPVTAMFSALVPSKPAARRPRPVRTSINAGERIADSALKSALERGLRHVGRNTVDLVSDDENMPEFIRARLVRFVSWFWSEIEREILSTVLLESSYAAQRTRAAELITLERRTPRVKWWPNPFFKLKCVILYTLYPYDMGFWGQLRSPLYWLLAAILLFPSYGVQPIAFLVLFLLRDKRDEFQLVSSILALKGFQFVSGGVIAGLIGGIRLQYCSAHLSCHHIGGGGAPGMYRGFYFETVAFVLNVVLVWAAFVMLPCSKQKGALGANLAAHESEERLKGARAEGALPPRPRGPVRRTPTLVQMLSPAGFDTQACCGAINMSSTRGGALPPLLLYDLSAFILSASLMAYAWQTQAGWLRRSWLYWCRVLYGLSAIPFLPFVIPPLNRVLLHAKPTAYNRRGRCMPPLSMRDRQVVRRLKLERQSFETLDPADLRAERNGGRAMV